jgi:hypothetical protein
VSNVGVGLLPDMVMMQFFLSRLHNILALYFSLLINPWPLSAVRSTEWLVASPTVLALAALVMLTLAGGTLALPQRLRRFAVLGLAIAVLSFAPALLSIVTTGLIGERYMYFSMAGLGVWVAAMSMAWPLPTAGATLALLLSSVFLIGIRTPDWTDNDHFFEASVEDTPNPYVNTLWAFHFLKSDQSPETSLAAARIYYDALNANPPYLGACGHAVTAMLKSGSPERAVALAPWTLERGCPLDGDYVGRVSIAQAFSGDWEAARELLASGPADPKKRDQLVQGVLHQLDGDTAAYEALRDTSPDPGLFDAQVQHLMSR